jgi:hypothetical protein
MYKPGEWVHTQDGIGQVTLSFPCYYQFWEKLEDESYRVNIYGENEGLANKLLGEKRVLGECYKYILFMKRLCDHDGNPKKRIMGFHAKAYENDKASKEDMQHIETALKDGELKCRFDSFIMKYPSPIRKWGLQVPEGKIDDLKSYINNLSANINVDLCFSVKSLYELLKTELDVDLTGSIINKINPNMHIFTHHYSVDSDNYYNSNNEEVICKITIEKND